jgi:hypothetical protein
MKKLITKAICFFLVFLINGCATVRLPANFELAGDYKARQIKTIAVLPVELSLSTEGLTNFERAGGLPKDEDICRIFYPAVIKALKHKNYAILDTNKMISLLQENGLENIQQVYIFPKGKLAKILNADALLYFYVFDVSSLANISFFVTLVDARDQKVLWSSLGTASQQRGMAGGVAGGVGGAIAAGIGLFSPAAAVAGAVVGSKVENFIFSQISSLEDRAKQTVGNSFKSLPVCRGSS